MFCLSSDRQLSTGLVGQFGGTIPIKQPLPQSRINYFLLGNATGNASSCLVALCRSSIRMRRDTHHSSDDHAIMKPSLMVRSGNRDYTCTTRIAAVEATLAPVSTLLYYATFLCVRGAGGDQLRVNKCVLIDGWELCILMPAWAIFVKCSRTHRGAVRTMWVPKFTVNVSVEIVASESFSRGNSVEMGVEGEVKREELRAGMRWRDRTSPITIVLRKLGDVSELVVGNPYGSS